MPHFNHFKYQKFDVSDEPELLRRMAEGDVEALHAVVLRYRPLVQSIARKYIMVPFEDLEQAGIVGLLEAAKRFDPTKSIGFGGYAKFWVRYHIQMMARDFRRIVKPSATRGSRKARTRYRFAARTLLGKLGRVPSMDELAEEIGCTRKDLDDAMSWMSLPEFRVSGTDVGYPDDSANHENNVHHVSRALLDFTTETEIEKRAELAARSELTEMLLEALSDRERELIRRYYLVDDEDEVSLRTLGNELGVSGERVRQIIAAALRKLRTEAAKLGAESMETVG